ncbi:MAG: tRNA (N(6)-L-threonylcarbamoyladenosine(37)-C(2))-methylthiotransferase MtaB [Chloroflexi bacterium RBG_13_46_14]|nr:MAG: tRNA (N(6)-L-threonylcarbamoyladenosine(37)-C(2))-methylthiotransferase MtaB [Chloroflexi bacterium RBG_13_46_14]
MVKIALDTLGCKLNQAETELLARKFREEGHIVVTSIVDADIYILNTCTVTHTADAKSRQLLRKIRRRNPNVILVVTGCYAQRAPETLSRIEGVALTAGNDDKLNLPAILKKRGFLQKSGSITPQQLYEDIPESRTRSFIRIQDGCSNFCSYCIVPFVRGREKSLTPNDILKQIRDCVSDGIKEIVLTGTEIGSYASNGVKLRELLVRILTESDVQRLRLSSLQPNEITPGLLDLWNDRRLCPHFHISLQSGSDSVLSRMNRRYDTAIFQKTVSLIRSRLPDVAITTDIITGFPGETDEEYRASFEMCSETGFARIHVFPYSRRPGTAAATMPGQVPDGVKTQRNRNLGILSNECAESYRQGFTGRTMDVLWETQSGGIWSGYTGNYIRIYTRSNSNLANKIDQVTLEKPFRDGMWGRKEGAI